MHYLTIKVILNTLMSHLQSTYDAHVQDVRTALYHAENYVAAKNAECTSMSFELGAVPMLFAIAFRCRVPSIRRRALAVLRKAPRRECTYDAEASLALAERIVRLEEAELGLPDPAEEAAIEARMDAVVLGEERRVHMVWSTETADGTPELRVTRFRPDGAGRWRLCEEVMPADDSQERLEVQRGLYPFYPVKRRGSQVA